MPVAGWRCAGSELEVRWNGSRDALELAVRLDGGVQEKSGRSRGEETGSEGQGTGAKRMRAQRKRSGGEGGE